MLSSPAVLLHEPIIACASSSEGFTLLRDVARGLGITFNALGRFLHRTRFGPHHRWRASIGSFVVLDRDLDAWMNCEWLPGEREQLAELQLTEPAEFLKEKAANTRKK